MLKKISYILILFISLFIFNSVNAEIRCNIINDMDRGFVFDDEGILKGTINSSGVFRKSSIYTIENSTKAGFVVKDEESCPKHLKDYSVKPHIENGSTFRDHETFSFTKTLDKEILGCSSYETYSDCISSNDFSCVWVERETGKVIDDPNVTIKDAYCNVENLQYIACGNSFDIPSYLPNITSFIINLLKIATPIILIFTSAISLLKAITAQKEDEMEKAKKTLIRRIGIAVLIFFTITITQFVIEKVADDDEVGEMSDCLSCFINNDCSSSKYYKNYIGNQYKCFFVKDSKFKGNCN